MHIYAFGSICRGDIDLASDVDLLAIVEGHNDQLTQSIFSIYSYGRLSELWREGNPFAWHLALESRIVHSSDGADFLKNLGLPNAYSNGNRDCDRFLNLFEDACLSLASSKAAEVFDFSTIFLSVRNFASCYSLEFRKTADFSRHSALNLGNQSIPIDLRQYRVLERARILCTRGFGEGLSETDIALARGSLITIREWMLRLSGEAQAHE
jgi:hypothetical protein